MLLVPDLPDRWPADHVALGLVDRHGLRDVEGDPNRPFALASVTKLLTSTAVLLGVEEGSVGLDDPCGPPGATLRHLLAHASGLAPDGDDVLAPPGRRRIYSNRGIELAAAHVEEHSGLPFAAYLTEGVLAPLGMTSTALHGSPAAGAESTVADLAAWVTEMLQPGRILAPATVFDARTPQFPDLAGVLPGYGRQDPNPWGLGFEIRGRKSPHWTGSANSPATFGHFGQSGTFVWIDPDAGCGLVALGDLAFGDWAVDVWPRLSDAALALALAGRRR